MKSLKAIVILGCVVGLCMSFREIKCEDQVEAAEPEPQASSVENPLFKRFIKKGDDKVNKNEESAEIPKKGEGKTEPALKMHDFFAESLERSLGTLLKTLNMKDGDIGQSAEKLLKEFSSQQHSKGEQGQSEEQGAGAFGDLDNFKELADLLKNPGGSKMSEEMKKIEEAMNMFGKPAAGGDHASKTGEAMKKAFGSIPDLEQIFKGFNGLYTQSDAPKSADECEQKAAFYKLMQDSMSKMDSSGLGLFFRNSETTNILMQTWKTFVETDMQGCANLKNKKAAEWEQTEDESTQLPSSEEGTKTDEAEGASVPAAA